MIIKISDFGPISRFDIDISKNFNLFVGNNNIGKSYAITVVYLILKNIIECTPRRFPSGSSMSIRNGFFNIDDLFDNTEHSSNINSVTEKSNHLKMGEEFDVTIPATEDIKNLINDTLIPGLNNSFLNTFSSYENLVNRFSGKSPVITIESSEYSVCMSVVNNSLKISHFSIDKSFYVKRIKQSRSLHEKNNKVIIYSCEEKDWKTKFSYTHAIIKFSIDFFYSINKEIQSVHYLPASRSGLYQALSAFGQIIAELSKNRSFLTKKIELPSISEPVSDYFIKLSDIRVSKKSFEEKDVNEIAKKIENDILKGKVDFNTQTKQLMFYPDKTDLKLELSSTSSMVSELAPIVSYLRYVISQQIKQGKIRTRKSSHLIMIEEPEAHLHPEIQIKLTEIFAQLVNVDVKLIITSHSNYIFNKVNNLIMDKKLKIEYVNSGVFKQTGKGSIICHLEANEYGVEDDNFSFATSSLFEEKIEIIDSMNKKENEVSDISRRRD